MKNVVFLSQARADLDGIWEYTFERWDLDQAESYVALIVAMCERLAGGQLPGKAIDQVGAGLGFWHVGSHILLYREGDERLEIIRILHQGMNIARHIR